MYFSSVTSQILGVSPIEGFDKIKATYARRLKDAEKSGDEATAALVGYKSQSQSHFCLPSPLPFPSLPFFFSRTQTFTS